MELAVSIDVEEEGLFTNRYDTGDAPVNNVGSLRLLDPVFRDYGIRPTLLVSYQVARSLYCRELLLELRDRWHGEIGAHLHPWNTPPLDRLPYPEPVPSELIPKDLLAAKLDALIGSISEMGVEPVSFRMGRFKWASDTILEKTALRLIAVSPMRKISRTGSSFRPQTRKLPIRPTAPGEPYPEVPMTIVPDTGLGGVLGISNRPPPFLDIVVCHEVCFHSCSAACSTLGRLKAGALLHRSWERVLSVFFHSRTFSRREPEASYRQG
jgi:hypothetical protein